MTNAGHDHKTRHPIMVTSLERHDLQKALMKAMQLRARDFRNGMTKATATPQHARNYLQQAERNWDLLVRLKNGTYTPDGAMLRVAHTMQDAQTHAQDTADTQ